jgi:hypothetical protein
MVSDLTFLDVVADGTDEWNSSHLAALTALLQQCFPGHPHVVEELRENASSTSTRTNRIVHQILAMRHGEPLGFIVVHANIARQIGVIHFLGIDKSARGTRVEGESLARHLIRAGTVAVFADGERCDRPLIHGVIAESEPEWLPVWEHWGFTPLPIDYAEPYHGMHWADHGEADFFEMTLMWQANPAFDVSIDDAIDASVMAFSVDHYLLPINHSRVAPMLRRSRLA